MNGTTKHLDGKSFILLLFLAFFLKNCQKNEERNFSNLLELKNYTIKKTKINDSIIGIVGENKNYKIKGLFNTRSNEKIGWWKIVDTVNDNDFDIEYVSPKFPKENQMKIYKKGILQKDLSMYYDYTLINNKFLLKIYYPKSSEIIEKVSFDYITGDTIKKMRINEGKVDCIFKNACYECEIPLSNNENAISGIVAIFTYKKNKKDVTLGNTNIYVKSIK